ncbi:HNH endonuclease signature motif containing protein [Lentzea sp. NPDC003310]|uniref:HNH endonuclease n=1 Tax=Lentzea sp. NPDC003310 TaxID=3154447 RepID=UPI0033A13408
MTDVRYRPGQTNDILRHALLTAWNWRCYWCAEPVEHRSAEIDHIVPKDSSKILLAEVKKQFDLPDNYDVHAPYNLAPICGRCNKEKSNHNLTHLPRIATLLRASSGHAPKIEHAVHVLKSRRGLASALMKVAAADLSDKKTREAFEVGAPAIVQRLAGLDAGKADFLLSRTVEIEDGDRCHQVELTLNARGRTSITVFEEVAGGDLETVLQEPVSELVEIVDSAATVEFEAADAMYGADVEPLAAHFELIVDKVEFIQMPSPMRLEFTLHGMLTADGSTTIARDSVHGDGIEYIQGDATVTGRFKIVLSWRFDESIGCIDVDEVVLESREINVSNAGSHAQYDRDLFGVDPESGNW